MSTLSLELEPDEWVRIMRIRLEMTQGELAQRLGVARQMVCYYENGILQVPQARMEAIKRMAEKSLS
jgi:DNA-binding XRE family transcriptional regulator